MVQIPPQPQITPEQALAVLYAWYADQQALATLKTREILARKDVAKFYFPEPREGTNRFDLGGGFDLIGEFTFNRKVDEVALDAVKAKDAKALNLNLDALFPRKPVLSVTAYRKLTPEQMKFVDALLDIDDGTPSLKIGPAANRDGQAAHVAAAEAAVAAQPVFATNAEDGEAGQYFTDGEGSFWLCVETDGELEWLELEGDDKAAIEAAYTAASAPAAPKKTARRGRKKAGE